MDQATESLERLDALVQQLKKTHLDGAKVDYAVQAACLLLEDTTKEEMIAESAAPSATPTVSASTNTTGLFSLPRELRDWIYEFCAEPLEETLDVGWQGRKGFSPLTQVNRQLRAEAFAHQTRSKTLDMCFCMLLDNRMGLFLRGPGVAIIPEIRQFFLQGKSSRLSFQLSELSGMHRDGGFMWLDEYDGGRQDPFLVDGDNWEFNAERFVVDCCAESNEAAAKIEWEKNYAATRSTNDSEYEEAEFDYFIGSDRETPSLSSEDLGEVFTQFRKRDRRDDVTCLCGSKRS